MGKYVDGFVVPVPKANLEAYRRMAEDAGKVWREYGALAFTECVADDVKPGEITSFPQSVKLEPDETVVFAWIVYELREHRDRVNEQVIKDPRGSRNTDPEVHAVRRQAHGLGRVRGARRGMSLAGRQVRSVIHSRHGRHRVHERARVVAPAGWPRWPSRVPQRQEGQPAASAPGGPDVVPEDPRG